MTWDRIVFPLILALILGGVFALGASRDFCTGYWNAESRQCDRRNIQ
jgi:hypothetical protein